LLLSLLSGDWGGEEKYQIHSMILGRNNTGKSSILRQISKTFSSVFVNGSSNISSAGLTVGVKKYKSSWCIEPGALVIADLNYCCIDNIHHIKKQELTSVFQSLEQLKISVSKASINKDVHTRGTVICSACIEDFDINVLDN